MVPGDYSTGTVTLKNSGSLDASRVMVSFSTTVINVVTPAGLGADDTDISDSLIVTQLEYNGGDLLAMSGEDFINPDVEAADANNDGDVSLFELHSAAIDNLSGLAVDGTAGFTMTVQLDPLAGNGNQGDSATTVVSFILMQ
jgi:hypothetical protein